MIDAHLSWGMLLSHAECTWNTHSQSCGMPSTFMRMLIHICASHEGWLFMYVEVTSDAYSCMCKSRGMVIHICGMLIDIKWNAHVYMTVKRHVEWVVSRIWMSHVTHMKESRHAHEWVRSHVNGSGNTYEWVMSHIRIQTNNTPLLPPGTVMSLTHMSHGTHTHESWHTHAWVMAVSHMIRTLMGRVKGSSPLVSRASARLTSSSFHAFSSCSSEGFSMICESRWKKNSLSL